MDITVLPGQGLMFPGHIASQSTARTAARDWLLAHGVSEWDAEQATETAHCGRAWWAGPEVGFGQEHHDGVEPVTVVHLPNSALAAAGA